MAPVFAGLVMLVTAVPAKAAGPAAQAEAIFSNRVATFNVCNPCRSVLDPNHHLDQIKDQIETYRPQVIALQEICVGEAELVQQLLAFDGYLYNLAAIGLTNRIDRCFPYGVAFGDALLSAAPLTNPLRHTYAEGGTEPRGYIAADTVVGGRSVRVFATHLAQAGQADVRQQEVNELLDESLEFPDSIVLGDFNAEPTNPELGLMWLSYRDADPACGPGPGQNLPPCQPTADAAPHRKKFDYIWLFQTGSFTAPSAGVHDNYSDHDLVHADLTVG